MKLPSQLPADPRMMRTGMTRRSLTGLLFMWQRMSLTCQRLLFRRRS
jgi:hypothetical protein